MREEIRMRLEAEYFDNPQCTCFRCDTKFLILHRKYGCVACNPEEDD